MDAPKLESSRAPKSSVEKECAAAKVVPPAKLPKVLREFSDEDAAASASACSSAAEASESRAAIDGAASSSPGNSDNERVAGGAAGGADGKSIGAGLLGGAGTNDSYLRPIWEVEEAAGCTSSCEPREMKDGSGLGAGTKRSTGGGGCT